VTKKKLIVWLLLGGALALFTMSQHRFFDTPSQKNDQIKIGTTNTTESQIIGNILKQLIHHETQQPVKLMVNLGSSSVLQQAMMRGDINISATRYTGTELAATLHQPAIHDADQAERTVRHYFSAHFDQTWFASYGFSDTYVVLVNDVLAKRYHLTKISDLCSRANRFKFAVDSSWYEKAGDGYQAFVKKYRLHFAKVAPMQVGLVYTALHDHSVQVATGYATDSRIISQHLVMLADDDDFFPSYKASLVVTNPILKAHPELQPLLQKLAGQISLKKMQALNYQVDDRHMTPAIVAKKFLIANHYEAEK
jgi:osmoprotectant transport system substrate-binding protein